MPAPPPKITAATDFELAIALDERVGASIGGVFAWHRTLACFFATLRRLCIRVKTKQTTHHTSVLSFIYHDSHTNPTLARAFDDESPVPTASRLIHAISSRARRRSNPPPSSHAHRLCAPVRATTITTHARGTTQTICHQPYDPYARVPTRNPWHHSRARARKDTGTIARVGLWRRHPRLKRAENAYALAYVPGLGAKRVAAHARGHHRRGRGRHSCGSIGVALCRVATSGARMSTAFAYCRPKRSMKSLFGAATTRTDVDVFSMTI